jgi:ribosomal protein L37AE/L43A
VENIVEFVEEIELNSGWPDDLRADVDKITPYPCQVCKEKFRSCERLANHHCWECKECRRVFRTSADKARHDCVPIENKRMTKSPRGRNGRRAFTDVS